MTTPQPAALPERFTKKPVTIEAVQFTEALRDAIVLDGVPCPEGVKRGATTWHQKDRKVWRADFFIDTLEGRMNVEIGDWIIRGVKGELYPRKPDIFEMTYDRAALQSQPAAEVSDAEIDALMPEPDGSAEHNRVKVDLGGGITGTEYDEVDAWSAPLVRQTVRAILSLRPQSEHPDTARCIKARNDLNAALHGDGALIDDLEHAVANACAKLKRRRSFADERAAFEEWMSEGGKWPKAVERGQNGDYLLLQTATNWATWQACASPRPQAVPMTHEQIRAILTEAGYDDANVQARADFINGARYAEAHHGITAPAGGEVE